MAQANGSKKRRIRKSAPTIRELSSSSSNTAGKVKRKPVRRVTKKVLSPVARVARSENSITRLLKKIFRPFAWLARKLVPKYFINSWRELKLVVWPGRVETWRLTLAVFVFATVFGLAIYFVDRGLDKLFKTLVID